MKAYYTIYAPSPSRVEHDARVVIDEGSRNAVLACHAAVIDVKHIVEGAV